LVQPLLFFLHGRIMEGVTDLASLLIYIASGATSALLSKAFERWAWFQAQLPSGKQMTVIGASAGLAMLAVFVQGMVLQRPFINDLVDPYIKILLPFVNLLVTQIVHGSDKAQEVKALQALASTERGDA